MLEVLLVGSAAKLGLVGTLGIRFPAPEGSGLLSYDPNGMKNFRNESGDDLLGWLTINGKKVTEGSGLLSFDPCGMKKRQLALPHSKAQPRAAVPHAQAGHARDRIGASMLPVI